MRMLISPAKSLDFEAESPVTKFSQPEFLQHSQALIKIIRKLTPLQLTKLMKISDKLAALNVARFQQWQVPFGLDNAKQAIYAFTGDVYTGLDVLTLNATGRKYLQNHLSILSGLYGLLKPLDLMQPYRLEMGTRLANKKGKNLYDFWKPLLTETINNMLQESKHKTLINLASHEYFSVIDQTKINGTVITPVFKDWKNGQYKIISFFAKRARGMMVRFAVLNNVQQAEKLKQFNRAGYSFNHTFSTDVQWVFTRNQNL